MKFLVIGDLHGNIPKIYFKDYDAIVCTGDFCSDKMRKYMFMALKMRMQLPLFPVTWVDLAGEKRAERMIKKSFEDGRKVLKHLNSIGVPVYIVPGNWDGERKEYRSLFRGLRNIVDCYHRAVNADGYLIIGDGATDSPEYPQHREDLNRYTKAELEEKKKEYNKLKSMLSSLFKKAKKPVIFLSHNIPFNTPIDIIRNKDSPRDGWHYGSVLARELILKYKPLVFIGGHLHEHFAKCKLGRTVAINAGFGAKDSIFLELEKGKIKKLIFHKGK